MKNPIKNGKEVFAVLSMATVMSISMSVKVDAASDVEVAAEKVAIEVQNDKTPSAKKSEDASAVKEYTAELEDNKEALVEYNKATDPGSNEVTGKNSVTKADTPALEVSEENKAEAVRSVEGEATQAESPQDKSAEGNKEYKLELGEENTPQAQGVGETSAQESGEAETQTEEDKNIQKADDANYGKDEKKIKDYDESERYKQTDLQQGNVNQKLYKTDKNVEKDGFKVDFKNPSAESPSKTEWGYQITIDKKTGQRTYTRLTVTDGGRVPAGTGEKPMMKPGEKLTPESPDLTFKPDENGEVTGKRQRNYNYTASEETLKHINSKDNPSTSFGMKDNYISENPKVKYFGDSFELNYKVNPWPNENDKLEELKLNKNNFKENQKHFVKGQDIDTGIKVDNIDDSARERLVGQVYNPINGKVIEGAKAYIDKEGKVKIKMPDGAVNADGTINENSDFYKDPELRGLTSLDVKFFARPRTAEEFKKIAETPNDFGEKGTYTETGAGTADINHKGKKVTIDKQGIDRYDHYNLIGNFSLQLDDTRYYDQDFIDQDNKPTKDNMTSNIRPGTEFKVKMYTPHNPTEHQKTGEQMNEALKQGQASGNLDTKFLDKKNKEIADKLGVKYEDFISKDEYKEKRWNLVTSKDDIAGFSIVAPKNAKAGDFVALSVEYTYTNGSKDVQKFIFVVQDSTYIRPEYDSSVDFPTGEQSTPAKVVEDDKKIKPNSYSLPDTLEADKENAGNKIVKDDKGNSWTVSIDKDTGKVTAKPLAGGKFNGGEKLQVPVVAHYVDEDEPGKDITEETVAEFYIKERANMTARYNAKAGKAGDKLSSDVILNEVDKYNRRPSKYTLESNTFTDDKGNTWNVTIDENTGKVTATVPNATEGKSIDGALLNVSVTAHYYDTDGTEKGIRKVEVQFVGTGTKGSYEYTEKKPFETKVEVAKDLAPGKWRYKVVEGKEQKGVNGSVTKKVTIKDSRVEGQPEIVKEVPPVNAIIEIGNADYTGEVKHKETFEIPFEVEVRYNKELPAGETKEIQKGVKGSYDVEYTQKIKNGSADGEMIKKESNRVEAKKHIIEIGTKNVCEIPPVKPDPKPGEDPKDPEIPGENKPNKPGTTGETPNKPGDKAPSNPRDEKPGKDKPNKPSEPGKNTPNKPGEHPSVDPKNPPQESPEKPNLEKENDPKLSETENVKEDKEEMENEEAKVLAQAEEEYDEANRVGNEAGEAKLAGDDKAPKTGDAGLTLETASAGLASGLLLLLGRFKRKKEDEKNKK